MVCSSVLSLAQSPWLILLLFLVCGVSFGSLQRGTGQLKVVRPSGKSSLYRSRPCQVWEGRQGDPVGLQGTGICSPFSHQWREGSGAEGVARLPCLALSMFGAVETDAG